MRGQISLETVAGIVTLLLLFLIVGVAQINQDAQKDIMSQRLEDQGECLRLSRIISHVYAGEDRTQITISTNQNISFLDYLIVLDSNYSCYTLGKIQPADANAGRLVIKKTGGVVVVANE